MRIATITWARNEEDILEYFLRHTATFADEIHIVLHRSTDNSEEIVRILMAEGLPIHLSRDEGLAHRQAAAMTELLNTFRSKTPDWIIPLDADEFLLCEEHMRDTIDHLHKHQASAIPWRTYVPTPLDDHAESNPVLRITHRRATEEPQYRKVIIPGSLLAHKDLRILPGSHCIAFGETLQHADCNETLHIAHFPVRNEAQIRKKIINGWESVLSNPDRIPGEEFHWEKLYLRCMDPRPVEPAELSEIALRYAANEHQTTSLIREPLTMAAHPA